MTGRTRVLVHNQFPANGIVERCYNVCIVSDIALYKVGSKETRTVLSASWRFSRPSLCNLHIIHRSHWFFFCVCRQKDWIVQPTKDDCTNRHVWWPVGPQKCDARHWRRIKCSWFLSCNTQFVRLLDAQPQCSAKGRKKCAGADGDNGSDASVMLYTFFVGSIHVRSFIISTRQTECASA